MIAYSVEYQGHVAILNMTAQENKFNPDSIKAFITALDQVENDSPATALVVQSSSEKVWCNGLDVNWLLQEIQASGETVVDAFMAKVYSLLKRVLIFPMPTIACINGHAFGAGAFLAFAHDIRFMRSDRGWLCFPEADLNLTLGPVFMALAKRVVPMPLLEEMQYTVRRIDASVAMEHHIITRACPIESLTEEALSYAKNLTRPRDVILRMKLETLEPTISAIDKAIEDLDQH